MVEAVAHPRFWQIRKGQRQRWRAALLLAPQILRSSAIPELYILFYFASLDLGKSLEEIAKFEMRNTMTQMNTVFYRAFNWLTNKK
jgi:hypothetical protein